MSRKKEKFTPVRKGLVGGYACGITAYARSHIGHARSAVAFDILVRLLRYNGYEVTFVRNFTDVDDKIIRRAAEEARTAAEVAEEYTRLFIGPGELPCQPMESPYRTKDAAVFQENTLAVRAIFREHGLQLARLMRIPDDHIATMCGFMAHEAERSLAELRAGNVGALAVSLRGEEAFVRDHMLTWVADFARCARRPQPAVLYPQMIEALAAFVRNDAVLLSEAACWAEEARDVCGEMIPGGLGALPDSPEAAACAEVSDALATLVRLHPFGVEDHELVSISV